jgi:hypothetical protein
MSEKSKLHSSLSRLLRRESSGSTSFGWFKSEPARKGRLDLSRAGEEKFISTIIEAREQAGQLTLIVDQLLPQPEDSFWNEPVSLQSTLTAFDSGMEEIAEFRALVGERIEVGDHLGVELTDVSGLERSSREYIAPVSSSNPVALSFVWMGSWVDVKPKRMTIKRFFFDAELDEFRSPEGYTVSQAIVKLEQGGTGVPVRLQLTRGRNGEYEAEITKIESQPRQVLTALIEEIWRTESGLSSRRTTKSVADVGYMKKSGAGEGPHIMLLSEDENWLEMLNQIGTVNMVSVTGLEALSKSVSESPCDLFIADADLWGDQAIAVERLLRSVSRYRMIPRVWISGHKVGQPWEPSEIHLGYGEAGKEQINLEESDNVYLDHVDYGAFDLMPRSLPIESAHTRLRWAMGGDVYGKGLGIMLVTQDARLRYRIGLSFLEEGGIRFTVFKRLEGLVPALQKRKPRWILLDASSFEVEIDALLARAHDWAHRNRGNVIVLARGAEHSRVTQWLKRGAKDIVLLDPSVREAMRRLRARVLGTE